MINTRHIYLVIVVWSRTTRDTMLSGLMRVSRAESVRSLMCGDDSPALQLTTQ